MNEFFGAWELFRDPILAAVVAGAVLGWLGVFVVLRRMVFVTATVTQAAGLGVALAFFCHIHLSLHVPPVIGAVLVALAAAALVSAPMEKLGLSRESGLALVWLVGSGGAVLVGDRISQEAHDVASILLGTAVLVDPADLWAILVVGGLGFAAVFAAGRGLVFAGFDPDGARVQGLPVRGLEFFLLAVIALVASVATRALGALPVFAFSVLPAMAALLVTPSLALAFPAALVIGGASGFLGYLAAFVFEFPVGACQTMVAASFVVAAVPLRLLRR